MTSMYDKDPEQSRKYISSNVQNNVPVTDSKEMTE
jgi:hypothetical protein